MFLITRLTRLIGPEDGQDLLEYGLLAALIALATASAAGIVGMEIHTFFWSTIGASI